MIPDYVKPSLWSYDTERLDLDKNKRRIITNILNSGTKKAVEWLFDTYEKEDIKEAVRNPMSGEWSKKSLHFWELVLDVKAGSTARKLPAN